MSIRERIANWSEAFLRSPRIAQMRYEMKLLAGVRRVAGWRQFFTIMGKLGEVRGGLNARYGNVLGNLVLSVAGSVNGCRFCGVGHLYAANVYYFESTGKLFPLDELQTHQLQTMPFEELAEYIDKTLSDPEFDEARRVMKRVFRLRFGTPPETDEDRLLEEAIGVWGFVNECTIPFGYDVQLENFGPSLSDHVPAKVIQQYQQARETARKQGS